MRLVNSCRICQDENIMEQTLEPQRWHYLGECGLDKKGSSLTASTKEYVFWLNLGVAFLRHTFGEPPNGWELEVIWSYNPHGPGQIPWIALGFSDVAEGEKAMAYADKLGRELEIFNKAVDWNAIASNPRYE